MLLVSRIIDVQEKIGLAEASIQKDHLFLSQDGTLLPETCCELIAQGYGVCEAFRRTQKGLTIQGGGYLATLRDMQSFASARVGDILTIRTEKTDECFDTHIVHGEVLRNKEKLAQATVYIFMWKGEPPKLL
jgi:predicted hotdog family 3-hydroxylacyl-ACP dehydratase